MIAAARPRSAAALGGRDRATDGMERVPASPDARHLQYRAVLTTPDTARTPIVERVTAGYRPAPGP